MEIHPLLNRPHHLYVIICDFCYVILYVTTLSVFFSWTSQIVSCSFLVVILFRCWNIQIFKYPSFFGILFWYFVLNFYFIKCIFLILVLPWELSPSLNENKLLKDVLGHNTMKWSPCRCVSESFVLLKLILDLLTSAKAYVVFQIFCRSKNYF
jgi:hypothetical protein